MAAGGQFLGASIFEGFDDDGAPLSAGKLWAWESGSARATLKLTFSDTAGTPNTNPITLDGDGRAVVVLEGGVYEFELKDSAGNVIWTIDGYEGSGVATVDLVSGLTLAAADGVNQILPVDATAGNQVVNLYTAVGHLGYTITVLRTDTVQATPTRTITLTPTGGQTINGAANVIIYSPTESITLVSNGTNWLITQHSPDQRSGTWTPAIFGSTSESGQVYATQNGRYTKKGRLCHFELVITLSTLGTITGNVTINLPFSARATAGFEDQFAFRFQNLTTAAQTVRGQAAAGSAVLTVYIQTTAAVTANTAMVQSDLAANSTLRCSGTYATDE